MLLTQTNLSDLKFHSRGKVRDIYDLGDSLLFIATDRLSAFDVVLPTAIPDKGKVLTRMSLFWFDMFRELVPNHVITDKVEELQFRYYDGSQWKEEWGNSTACRRTRQLKSVEISLKLAGGRQYVTQVEIMPIK